MTDRASTSRRTLRGTGWRSRLGGTTLKGTCQISTAAGGIVAKTVTLVSCSPAVTLAVGDKWQGVYRFDNLTKAGGAALASVDPTRVGVLPTGSMTVAPTGSIVPGKRSPRP